jgi:hypothetical protein
MISNILAKGPVSGARARSLSTQTGAHFRAFKPTAPMTRLAHDNGRDYLMNHNIYTTAEAEGVQQTHFEAESVSISRSIVQSTQ